MKLEPSSIIHFLYGLVNAIVAHDSPILAIIMFTTFILYEYTQLIKKRDSPTEELREYGAGLWTGALLLLIYC